MIRLIPTEHKKGVKLQGDYDDLYTLRDALGNYLDFYRVCTDYPYHDYEYLLSLNYDIRHAYMGTRDYAAVDNAYHDYQLIQLENDDNIKLTDEEKDKLKEYKKTFRDKNLYFSVDIALPLILYYLSVFQKILDTGCTELWFEKYNLNHQYLPVDYTPLQAEKDRAQMTLYNAAVWDYLEKLVGAEETNTLFRYFTYNEDGVTFPADYIDALLAYFMENVQHLEGEDLKQFIIYTAYCIFDPISANRKNKIFQPCHEQYQKAWNQVKPKVTKRMPPYYRFIEMENRHFGGRKEIYEDEFEKFIARYFGNPDWENVVW